MYATSTTPSKARASRASTATTATAITAVIRHRRAQAGARPPAGALPTLLRRLLAFRASALLLALLLLSFSHRVCGERARPGASWLRAGGSTSTHTVPGQQRAAAQTAVTRASEQPRHSERPAYGVASMQGRRSYMEDYHATAGARRLGVSLFGVFDGHGGWEAAAYAQDQLFANVLADLHAQAEAVGVSKRDLAHAFDAGFACTERNLLQDLEHTVAGSTAVCAAFDAAHLTLANLGDSRAVLGRRDGSAHQLTRDHKPELDDERERIEALGGFVSQLGVWRVQGVLATSRALGDRPLKPFVSALPEQCERTLVAGVDDFLVLASDGLFDVLSNQEVVQLVRERLAALPPPAVQHSAATAALHGEQLARVAEHLCSTAYARGSADNITAMVVDLRSYLEHVDQQAWMAIKHRSV
jgi:protein phosphatase 1L